MGSITSIDEVTWRVSVQAEAAQGARSVISQDIVTLLTICSNRKLLSARFSDSVYYQGNYRVPRLIQTFIRGLFRFLVFALGSFLCYFYFKRLIVYS